MSLTAENISSLPTHVAIVPDGNGRWAEKRGLPRLSGHREGVLNMLRIIQYISDYPIKYITFYGFSTENWNRPEAEVKGLFRILHIGRLEGLPDSLQNKIQQAVSLTANNTGLTLGIAWNYGGRAEIVDAVTKLMADPAEDAVYRPAAAGYRGRGPLRSVP